MNVDTEDQNNVDDDKSHALCNNWFIREGRDLLQLLHIPNLNDFFFAYPFLLISFFSPKIYFCLFNNKG